MFRLRATLDARSSLRGDWPAVALDYGQLGGSVRWCGSFSVPDVGSHVPTPLFHAATGSQACALCSAVVASEFIVYSLSGRPFGVCSSQAEEDLDNAYLRGNSDDLGRLT